MTDFYNRNMTRPAQEKQLPDYLKPFKYLEPDDKLLEAAMLEKLKKGEYDIKEEEEMLVKLHK